MIKCEIIVQVDQKIEIIVKIILYYKNKKTDNLEIRRDVVPGRKTHMRTGILVSFLLFSDLVLKGPVLSPIILPAALASSILGAVLPDMIEPPKNRHHRKFFHSLLFLVLLMLFLIQTYLNLLTGGLADEVTIGLFFAGAGYASHLVLDALTPAGLPVVGL